MITIKVIMNSQNNGSEQPTLLTKLPAIDDVCPASYMCEGKDCNKPAGPLWLLCPSCRGKLLAEAQQIVNVTKEMETVARRQEEVDKKAIALGIDPIMLGGKKRKR